MENKKDPNNPQTTGVEDTFVQMDKNKNNIVNGTEVKRIGISLDEGEKVKNGVKETQV